MPDPADEQQVQPKPASQPAQEHENPTNAKAERWPLAVRVGIRVIFALLVYGLLAWLNPNSSPDILGLGSLYQRIMGATARGVAMNYVSILEIRPEEMDGHFDGANVCEQRRFVAALVRGLTPQLGRSGVIVIDKYFGAKTCDLDAADKTNTRVLQDAFTQAAAAGVTVVVGRTLEGSESTATAKRTLLPAYAFQNVREGLIELAADPRQAPLALRYGLGNDKVGTKETLAWKAVEAFQATRRQELARLEPSDDKAPFIRFPEDELLRANTHSAAGALCRFAPQEAVASELKCASAPAFDPEALRNRVLLIAEPKHEGEFSTPAGPLLGHQLQASYIESLLDRTYAQPTPWWFNVLLVVWAVSLIEYLRERLVTLRGDLRSFVLFTLGVAAVCLAVVTLEVLAAQAFNRLFQPLISLPATGWQLLEFSAGLLREKFAPIEKNEA